MNLSILYRGWLTSCNYSCRYCPFAKRFETPAQLTRDRQSLESFSTWLRRESHHRWKVLFTPWGEALVRPWYRQAVVQLSQLAHVESVSAQTNLSCSLDWVKDCRPERVAFWATYHPEESDALQFVRKVQKLCELGARVSVGMVGVPEFLDQIVSMRRQLPRDVYLWINAQQPRLRPYMPQEVAVFRSIDPQFELSVDRQKSLGKPCRTGEVSFTVDGAGDMRRCHFVDEVIGNIQDENWHSALRPRRCPNRFCNCFLGKSQLQAESLIPFFGDTLLERLPANNYMFESAADG